MSARNRRAEKAARRAERGRRAALSPVPVLRQGRLPGPRADAVVRRFFESFAGENPPRSCPHLDLDEPLDGQPHAYWSAHEPGVVRCGTCRERAALVPASCNHCGEDAGGLHMTDVHLGPMTATLGLCGQCHDADQADAAAGPR